MRYIRGMIKTERKLREQQKRFCQLWVEKQNLADAWLAAGYKSKNRNSAKRAASRLMSTNVYAQDYISELLKEQEQRAEKTVDDAIAELARIAFADVTNSLTYSHKLQALKEFLDRLQGRPRQQVDVRKVSLRREISKEELAELMAEKPLIDYEDAIAT